MAEPDTSESDLEVARKFFDALEAHGITRDGIETVSEDPDAMHAVAHVLRRIIPEAEQRADRNLRRQKLVSDIDGLEVSPQIVEKLLEGGYDKLYKLTVATSYELQEDGLLTQDEVRQVNDVLHDLGFEGLRPDDTTIITRLLNLWGSWAHVPTEVRKFYEQ